MRTDGITYGGSVTPVPIALTHAQAIAVDRILHGESVASVIGDWGRGGGKTTVLATVEDRLHERYVARARREAREHNEH